MTKFPLYDHLVPPDVEARSQLIHDILLTSRYILVSGEILPIGCVSFFMTYSTFLARSTLFIEDLFVLSDYRGQGFGRALFTFCRNEARTRGCGRMEWIVLSRDEPSIRFYEKVGERKMGWDVFRLEGEEM